MQVFLNILILLVGLAFLIKGADYFVSGASAVAKKLKVSTLVIGLTVVAIGTSLPELAVSITSAVRGNVEMSVGNVVGSNMANMFLIVGFIALLAPVKVKESSKKFDIPFMVFVTGILLLFCMDVFFYEGASSIITRTESIAFLLLLICYIIFIVLNAKKKPKLSNRDAFEKYLENLENEVKKQNVLDEEKTEKSFFKKIWKFIKGGDHRDLKIWEIVFYLVIGVAGVVLGGEAVARTAENLALMAGMSETLVGITIIAIGTSLPELVTSAVAAKKGETDLAIGNVVGSNIMNILLILGVVGVINPITVSPDILIDLFILFVFSLIFAFISLFKMKISKISGLIFLLMYFSYMSFAIVRNYCF